MSAPPKLAFPKELHFHIRWSSTMLLDWQAFKTREQAESTAKDLVRESETYTIEARLRDCERCKQAAKGLTGRGRLEDKTGREPSAR